MEKFDPKGWQDPTGEYGFFYGSSLLSRPPVKGPIIEHLLYERDVVCTSSIPGVGKSMLALQLLCALTSGQPFLGTYRVTRPCNVLYIQTEGDRAETLERLEKMTKGCQIDHSRWAHVNLPGLALNDIEQFQDFKNMLSSYALLYDVILIDPLYTTVKGSLKEDVVATEWIKNVRELKAIYDCAIWGFHHDAKQQYHGGEAIEIADNVTYGSVFWQAFFNHNFKLKRNKDVFTLIGGKQRSNKIIDRIEMVLRDDPLMFVPINDETDNNTIKVLALITGIPMGCLPKEIIEKTGLAKTTVYRILTKLCDNFQIEETTTRPVHFKIRKVLDISNTNGILKTAQKTQE